MHEPEALTALHQTQAQEEPQRAGDLPRRPLPHSGRGVHVTESHRLRPQHRHAGHAR